MGPLLAAVVGIALAASPEWSQRLSEAMRLEKAGDTSGALAAYRELLPLTPADHQDRARILITLAMLESRAGEYTASAKYANEAANLFAARGETRRQSQALNNAGLAYLYAGDYGRARPVIQSAIDVAPDADVRAEAVSNLGNVDYYIGRYSDAATAYDHALRLSEDHRDEAWSARRRLIVQVNRATLYQKLGRDQEALAIYRDLTAKDTTLPPREQAQMLVNLGVLYRHLGDAAKALEAYDNAQALFARDRFVDGELNVMKNRGIVFALDLGRLDTAFEVFGAALDEATAAGNRREMLQARLYRGETALRAGQLDLARDDFEASGELARALGTREEEWKSLYGLGRIASRQGRHDAAAREFERAVEIIESIREAVRVPSLKSDFFTDKREVYDALIAATLDTASPERLLALLERSHSRTWRERLGLAAGIDTPALQRALPPGVVVLDFWQSDLGSAVVIVTATSAEVQRVLLDPAAVERLHSAVSSGASDAWHAPAEAIAAGLRLRLPSGTNHVIVVPDGAFALVPFELLPIGGRLLVEQAAVSYVPTATLLLRAPSERAPMRPPWSLQLGAFGEPLFTSAALDEVAQMQGTLTGSGDEVRAIASELAGRAALHVGADNRKAFLTESAGFPPMLHIASHAMADVDALEQSRILFSPPDGQSSAADYLFLKEAYGLNLDGVELAVLSACETERGRASRGEGVQSFSRAFLAAGARSTVTTLWRVPDQATAAFMKVFYHHLQRGESRDEALRLAKRKFLESGTALSDPHYWAAFVLTGDGIHPVPRAVPWSMALIPIGGLAAAGVGARALRRRPRYGSGVSRTDAS